jgi:hypothetical protein
MGLLIFTFKYIFNPGSQICLTSGKNLAIFDLKNSDFDNN